MHRNRFVRSAIAALGIMGAVVASGTALAAPQSVGDFDLLVKDDKPKLPPQATIVVPPQPITWVDLDADYLNSGAQGSNTLYRFRIKNVGTKAATGVKVERNAVWRDGWGSHAYHTDITTETLGTVNPGEERIVTVTCSPESGGVCLGGGVTAKSGNGDINLNNNVASN